MDLRPSTLKALFLEGMRQANEGDEPEAPETPPPPAEPPAPPVVPPARIGREATGAGHNVPNWWDKDKTLRVTTDGDDDSGCTHPNPRTARVGASDQLVPYWCPDCKTTLTLAAADTAPAKAPTGPPASAPAEDEEDQEDNEPGPDDEVDGDGDEAEEDGGKAAGRTGSRWLYGSGKKRYTRPVYAQKSAPKQSLLEWWGSLSRTTRHGLYNGAALGIGFWVGVPQFFTHEVAHLVATYHSWTAFYVCVWYVIAAVIWAVDHKSRDWLPPLALLGRVPLISMIIGALLYGTGTPTI